MACLKAICTNCAENRNVVLLGDFNAKAFNSSTKILPNSSDKDDAFNKFLSDSGLISLCNSPNTRHIVYTYTKSRSTIDHILVEKPFLVKCTNFRTLPEKDIVTSDHLPLIVNIELSEPYNSFDTEYMPGNIAWNKCTQSNLQDYAVLLEKNLTNIQNHNDVTPNYLSNFSVDTIKNLQKLIYRR